MKKKLIAMIMVSMMALTVVGCGDSKEGKSDSTTEVNKTVEISKEDSDKNLNTSTNTKDSTRVKVSQDEIVQINDKYNTKMEEILQKNGFEPQKYNKSKIDFLKDTYVGGSLDEDNVPNAVNNARLERMLSNNGIISFNINVKYVLNPEEIAAGKEIDVKEMDIEGYSSVFVDDYKVDYNKINSEINKILKDGDSEVGVYTIEIEEGVTSSFRIYEDEIAYEIFDLRYVIE